LRLSPDIDACCAVEGLQELGGREIRFRTRALTTTLFARMLLGDLFVHGIGGAKYDEMTDRIMTRFYGLEPPPFLMATATLHLPLGGRNDIDPGTAQRLRTALRDIQFSPERHGVALVNDPLITEKLGLLAERASQSAGLSRRERRARRPANRERHARLQAIASELSARADSRREQLQSELAHVERRLSANSILEDREYGYCLYPAETLRALFTRAAALVAG
jgi:hypothetical protein